MCFVGALGCGLNVEKLRLARSLRAPPRIWTLLAALRRPQPSFRAGGEPFCGVLSVWQRGDGSIIMECTMGTRGGRNPVRVGNLLTAAVPALAERMLEEAIRREWGQTAGPEAARRSRPAALRQGTLEVSVDNSPWLQELTLRSAAIVAALRKRHGSAVTGVRFALGSGRGDAAVGA